MMFRLFMVLAGLFLSGCVSLPLNHKRQQEEVPQGYGVMVLEPYAAQPASECEEKQRHAANHLMEIDGFAGPPAGYHGEDEDLELVHKGLQIVWVDGRWYMTAPCYIAVRIMHKRGKNAQQIRWALDRLECRDRTRFARKLRAARERERDLQDRYCTAW